MKIFLKLIEREYLTDGERTTLQSMFRKLPLIKSSGMNFPAHEKIKTAVAEIVVPATADVVIDIKFFSGYQFDKPDFIFVYKLNL